MSLTARLLALLLAVTAECALFVSLGLATSPITNDVWAVVGLTASLIITCFIIEPFFSKPTDILAAALLSVVVLFSVRASVERNVWLYVAFMAGLAVVAAVASITVLLHSAGHRGRAAWTLTASKVLHSIISRGVPSRAVNSAALLVLPVLLPPDEGLVLFSFMSCALINIARPDTLGRGLAALGSRRDRSLGSVQAIRSDGRFLARAADAVPDVLDLCVYRDGNQQPATGLVTRRTRLHEEDRFEFVPFPEVAPTRTDLRPDEVAPQDAPDVGVTGLIAGVVAPQTTISTLRFQTFPSISLSAGDLLHVQCGVRDVIYQIFDASLVEERTSGLDSDTEVFSQAKQVGFWSEDQETFDAYGWVPPINALVRRSPELPENPPKDDEIAIGVLPGTKFSVNLNYEDSITHHCAILGVTGTGKSVFVRQFVRSLTAKGFYTICVDLTGEYAQKLGTDCRSVVNDETEAAISKCINWLVAEEAKFPNQRDNSKIAECKAKIVDLFSSSIKTLVEGKRPISVLGMADLDGSAENVEYLRWFCHTLFKMAKKGDFGGAKLALILEEAHTIVPEPTFLSAQDNRTKGLVNSISQIALQGRKYGIGLVVVAQRTANVSKTILTQCNTIIAFRQFDRTSFDFLTNILGDEASRVLPTMRTRHAYVAGKGLKSSTPMIFKVPDLPGV